MTGRIDLNADLGEGYGFDGALMRLVTSCNIACGGHAGDPVTMRETLIKARNAGVVAGAHPSYPDREGFGRRAFDVEPGHLLDLLAEQVRALTDLAAQEGVRLAHIKPHGALYHAAAAHRDTAEVIIRLMQACLPDGRLVGPPTGALREAAAEHNIIYHAEGFVDRVYLDSGDLVPRDQDGAVLDTLAARVAQALDLARSGRVTTWSGCRLALPVQTLCLHGDTEGALDTARAIRRNLLGAGIEVVSLA